MDYGYCDVNNRDDFIGPNWLRQSKLPHIVPHADTLTILMFQEIRLSLSVAGSTNVGLCYVISHDMSALYKRVHVNPHLLCASAVYTCNI